MNYGYRSRNLGYRVDVRVRMLVWLACFAVAYLYTAPIYQGIQTGDAWLRRLLYPPPPPSYLVAATEMLPGHVIELQDLEWKELEGYVADAAITDLEAVVGETVHERILAGDLMRPERLAVSRSSGLAALVPPGHRALSIHLTGSDRVQGFMEPGDRVDVLVTLIMDRQPRQTVTLLENVLVLSMDDHLAAIPLGQRGIKPQVALLTTPQEANRLIHALRHGKPRLVLRAEGDDHRRLPRVEDHADQDLGVAAPQPSIRARRARVRRARQVAEVRRTFGEDLMPDRQTFERVQALMVRDGILDAVPDAVVADADEAP